MRLYPAIDLRAGRCVRLRQGDPARETVFGDDPAAVARRWVESGAAALHVVDLDGAFAGRPVQLDAVRAVAAAVPGVAVQLGGGLRTEADLQAAREAGAARLVIGTGALDPAFLRLALERYGERLVCALDARDGVVAVAGWQVSSGLPLARAARDLRDAGVREVLYTNVARDGMLSGPDTAGVAALADLGLRVIASGGVSRVEDVTALAAAGASGAVIGRALYDGRVSLPDALRAADPAGR